MTGSSKSDRDILTFLMIPQKMGRAYTAGPGIPSNRLATLRKAFDDTMKDPAFLRDAQKVRMKVKPITATAMDKLVARLGAMPQETIQNSRKLLVRKKIEPRNSVDSGGLAKQSGATVFIFRYSSTPPSGLQPDICCRPLAATRPTTKRELSSCCNC